MPRRISGKDKVRKRINCRIYEFCIMRIITDKVTIKREKIENTNIPSSTVKNIHYEYKVIDK